MLRIEQACQIVGPGTVAKLGRFQCFCCCFFGDLKLRLTRRIGFGGLKADIHIPQRAEYGLAIGRKLCVPARLGGVELSIKSPAVEYGLRQPCRE